MTREEAIEIFNSGGWWDMLIPVTTIVGRNDEYKLHEAIDVALSALTPPTQEQMERVWRAEWIRYEDSHEQATKYICSQCGDYHAFREDYGEYTFNGNYLFCRRCGRAMTPAALEELRKRWEALDNESHSD